jgi:hypothetical protein
MYWIHEYYLNQWSTIISSLTSLHNIEKTHVLYAFKYFFWNVSTENTCHNSTKLNYKYLKVKHQLELLYFQVDERLMCGYNFNFSLNFFLKCIFN